MKSSFWTSLALMLLGLAILVAPDNGRRIFSFNDNHGPSLLDLVGIFIITGAWIFWVVRLFNERARIIYHTGRTKLLWIVALLVIGIAAIITGLVVELDLILYAGIILSIAAYAIPIWIAFRRPRISRNAHLP